MEPRFNARILQNGDMNAAHIEVPHDIRAFFGKGTMNSGTRIYMLVEEQPIGIVSVTHSLIEDLYVLPYMQNMGHGTKLLQCAIDQCADAPTLWILENNTNAERLYHRMGFRRTGKRNASTDGLDEIEFALTWISVFAPTQNRKRRIKTAHRLPSLLYVLSLLYTGENDQVYFPAFFFFR